MLLTTPDGTLVFQADLREGGVDEAIAAARASGAQTLWAYGSGLDDRGFVPANGYTRLRCAEAPRGEELPETHDAELVADLLRRCYEGLWGHRLPDPDAVTRSVADGQTVHLVLDAVGLCRVDPAERLIDAPGVVVGSRAPAAYVRLALGAGAALGPGPATIESWGDDASTIDAYVGLGYVVERRVEAWTLALRSG